MGFDAPDIVWSQCQIRLQSELPEQQYNTWIRPLKINYLQDGRNGEEQGYTSPNDEDIVQLVAPNRFVEEWVKNKFLRRIEELFHQLSGSDIALAITANSAQIGRAHV